MLFDTQHVPISKRITMCMVLWFDFGLAHMPHLRLPLVLWFMVLRFVFGFGQSSKYPDQDHSNDTFNALHQTPIP